MPTATAVLAASRAPSHPALRWTPLFADSPAQHRRAGSGDVTACGIVGVLTLAEATDPRCGTCFPGA